MKLVTLLLKVMAKSVCPYVSKGSSLFLCGLLLKSLKGQLRVGCAKHAHVGDKRCVTHVAYAWLIFVRAYYTSIISIYIATLIHSFF